jgi:hypothetical protein
MGNLLKVREWRVFLRREDWNKIIACRSPFDLWWISRLLSLCIANEIRDRGNKIAIEYSGRTV